MFLWISSEGAAQQTVFFLSFFSDNGAASSDLRAATATGWLYSPPLVAGSRMDGHAVA